MADALKVFLLVLSAPFPIVDPLAGGPIFLAMTREYSSETRRALSWRVAVHSLLLMTASYFIGSYVLSFFGVSVPVVQVAGGLVVVSMGWAMLRAKEEEHHVSRRTVETSDIYGRAFYPLTMPLTVALVRFQSLSHWVRIRPITMGSISRLYSQRSLPWA
jgi:multiple antibiotic resistance protein